MCRLSLRILLSEKSDAKIIIFIHKMSFSHIIPTKRTFLHKNG